VLRSNPGIDKIFTYEKDEYREMWRRSKLSCVKMVMRFLDMIRRERFNIMIDLSLGYHHSLFLKMAGIKRRAGFNYRNRGRFLTDKVDISGFAGKHVIEHYMDVLKAIGLDTKDSCMGPRVYLSDHDRKEADKFLEEHSIGPKDMLVGMLPGCGASWGVDSKYRRWDKANFARIADLLAEKYKAKVIFFGDNKETELCESAQSMMKHKAVMACGRISIGTFLALASRCTLIITNDGGPLHMSVGLGVKTVSIFGPVDEKVYGPYPPGERHITVTADVPCRPCYRHFKYVKCETQKCLKAIRPEDVMKAVDRLLAMA
jgi:ADP-heptose:LPS heptosyltransferase